MTEEFQIEDDLYEILGIGHDASQEEIRTAFRRKVKESHPDIGGDPEEFVKVTAAYNVLSNPDAKSYYDSTGDVSEHNPLMFQQRVIGLMGSIFDALISSSVDQGIDVDQIPDFIETFKEIVFTNIKSNTRKVDKAESMVKSLKKMEKRIKRKGEQSNVFAEHIGRNLIRIVPILKEDKLNLRAFNRILEEIENYSDIHDFIRTMQAGAYPADRTSTSRDGYTILGFFDQNAV